MQRNNLRFLHRTATNNLHGFTGVGTMECAPQILIRYPSNSVATLTDTRWSAHSTLPFGEGPIVATLVMHIGK